MTRSALGALLLLATLAAPAAAQQNRLFFKSTTPTVSPEAWQLDNHLTAELGKALMDKYPCMEQVGYDAVAAELSMEADKARQGKSEPGAVERIGNKLDSDYTVLTQVTPLGTAYVVQVTVMNTRTARTVLKQSTQVPQSSPSDGVGAAAQRAAAALEFPACPATDWSGTVVVVEQYSGSTPGQDGNTVSGNMLLNLDCRLDGMNGSEAKCSVTYNSAMNMSDGSYIKQSAKDNITCSIRVESDASGTRLEFGMIRLKTHQSAKMEFRDQEGKGITSVSEGPNEQDLGSWEFKGPPMPRGARTLSGSGTWGNAKATWTLKPPAGY